MNRRRAHAGFTLLELIVVLSLLGAATTMGGVMMFKISDAWRLTTIRTDLGAKADAIFSAMRQDFDECVSAKLAGVAIHASAQTANDDRFYRIPLESDDVTIPVETALGPGARAQRANVHYFIDRKQGAPVLMRETRLPGGEAVSASLKVAEGVIAMSIESIGKGPESGWQRGWTEPSAPGAVRVSLTLSDPDRPMEQVARKAVFPIKVD